MFERVSNRHSRCRFDSRAGLLIGLLLALAGLFVSPTPLAQAATITVTNANDTTSTGDGVSLREAILSINAGANVNADVIPTGAAYGTDDTIRFAIPSASDPACNSGTGVCTIAVASGGLPVVTKTVMIDGYTQPGAAANTGAFGTVSNASLRVELNGIGAGPGVAGLTIGASSVTVRGLVIRRFKATDGTGVGILVTASGGGSTISGCYLGTDRTGTVSHANQRGIVVDGAPNVTIGGTAPAARNLVAGNADSGILVQGATAAGVKVQGNYVGLKAVGDAVLANGTSGIVVIGAPGATIGGTAAGAGNVTGGNGLAGISIEGAGATGAIIQGNRSGTNAAGTAAIPNTHGIVLQNAPNASVGGATVEARNIVSGNQSTGISVAGPGAVIRGNYIGTNVNGDAAIGNRTGVDTSGVGGVVIGGTAPGEGNLISGNEAGIGIFPAQKPDPVVQGNAIGTNASRTGPLGNTFGITMGVIVLPPPGVTLPTPSMDIGGTAPGAANIIAYNRYAGISSVRADGLRVRGNSIYGNAGLGIDLAGEGVTQNDPEDASTAWFNPQNFPVLTGATFLADKTRVTGSLNSTPETAFTLDFYASLYCHRLGYGEGQTHLGSVSVTTNDLGNVSFTANVAVATAGSSITATATNANGSTSELSACTQPPAVSGFVVTPTSGLVTTEAGGKATFTVRLTTAPSAPVTIPLSSNDPSEGTLSATSLTFPAGLAALTPQTVTVTGQDDVVADGDQPYGIVMGYTISDDVSYASRIPPVVSVTNRDDDNSIRCSPRPSPTVTTANNGDGRLRVTVTATTSLPGLQNRLSQLQFEAGTNANVQLPGQPTRTGPFAYDIPGQPTSFTFYVGRQGQGATMLPFRVVDDCNASPWRTFVGGGPGAF